MTVIIIFYPDFATLIFEKKNNCTFLDRNFSQFYHVHFFKCITQTKSTSARPVATWLEWKIRDQHAIQFNVYVYVA